MVSMQQVKLLVEEAAQELKRKAKGELFLMAEEQIALHEDVKMTTNGLADQHIALKKKINRLERNRPISRFELKIAKGLATNIGSL